MVFSYLFSAKLFEFDFAIHPIKFLIYVDRYVILNITLCVVPFHHHHNISDTSDKIHIYEIITTTHKYRQLKSKCYGEIKKKN